MEITQTDTTLICKTKRLVLTIAIGVLLLVVVIIFAISMGTQVWRIPSFIVIFLAFLAPALFFILIDTRTQLVIDKTSKIVVINRVYMFGHIKRSRQLSLSSITGISSDISPNVKGGGSTMTVKLQTGASPTVQFVVRGLSIGFTPGPTPEELEVQQVASFLGVPVSINRSGRPLEIQT
jgi:hypothetical protein